MIVSGVRDLIFNYNFNTFMPFMVQYLSFYHEGLEEHEEREMVIKKNCNTKNYPAAKVRLTRENAASPVGDGLIGWYVEVVTADLAVV